MAATDTSVTITEGMPSDSPWIINDLDVNLKNLALARLAALGANQGILLKKQTAVLVEQASNLDALQATVEKVGSANFTALVVDPSGKALITDASVVSDLVGKSITSGSDSNSDIDRLIQFTGNLESSSPQVNLGGQPYVKASFGQKAIEAPLEVLKVSTESVPTTGLKPFVCYQIQYPSGKTDFVMSFGATTIPGISPSSLQALPFPQPKFAYDAYRLNIGTASSPVYKVYIPQNVSAFPSSAATDTLYRDIYTGEMRLVGSSPNSNIAFLDPKGFVIPSSDAEVHFWLGQASAARLAAATAQFNTDGIKLDLAPDTTQWVELVANAQGGATGYGNYPPKEISGTATPDPFTDPSLKPGTLIKYQEKYCRVGSPVSRDTLMPIKLTGAPFAISLTKDNLVSIRGQYTEKIIQGTQRSTEQQLFVNSLLQKHNYHFDAATNVLKAFSDLNSKLASSL